jgi:hypothetical protein
MRISHPLLPAVLSLLPLAAAAQTFTWLQDIPIGGVDGTPAGVIAVGNDAYVAGFSNRRVIKVTDFDSTIPSASQLFATDVTENPTDGIAWPVSTGLVTIDYRSGDDALMVAGDTFGLGDGMIYQINATSGALIQKQGPNADGGLPARVAGAAFYGASNVLAQFTAGTNYWQFNSTLTSAGFYSGPTPVNSRDIAIDQATGIAYISYNNGTTAGIHRIIDGGTAFDIAGNTNEASWYTTTMSLAGGTLQGISLGTIGSTQYAFLCLRDDADVLLIPTTSAGVPANAGAVITINVPQLTRPSDAFLATVGPSQYLIVSQHGGNNVLSVFGVNGATLQTTVSDWVRY